MVITDVLARNAALYGDEVCLVCVNPEMKEKPEVTWRDYELQETNAGEFSRREMTWRLFDEGANRFAHLLLSRGIGQGDKVSGQLAQGRGRDDLRFDARQRRRDAFGVQPETEVAEAERAAVLGEAGA